MRVNAKPDQVAVKNAPSEWFPLSAEQAITVEAPDGFPSQGSVQECRRAVRQLDFLSPPSAPTVKEP